MLSVALLNEECCKEMLTFDIKFPISYVYGITVDTAGLPEKVTIQKVSSIFSEIGATHGKPG